MTFSSTSEALSRLLPGPTVPGFQKVKDADMVGAYQQFLITQYGRSCCAASVAMN